MNTTSIDSAQAPFKSVAIQGADLRLLHESVSRHYGRVELTDDADACCVLISKAELACMEEALEIFASLPGADEVRKHIERLAGEDCNRTINLLREHHERAARRSKI